MPPRPPRVCRKAGCQRLTTDPSGYCEAHVEWGVREEEARLAAIAKKSDAKRGHAAARGYNHKWAKARETFLKRNPLCVECEKVGRAVPATVVDHIEPHHGDSNLFWNTANWQSLCRVHHDQKTRSGR